LVLVKPISGEWLSGFVSGDGGFNGSILKSKYGKPGFRVNLRFHISQETLNF
jgi:hypothetical protein